MDKAFQNFEWKNFPSTDTPVNATNLNKINNGLDTVDDRVLELYDNLDSLETSVNNEIESLSDSVDDDIDTINRAISNVIETIGQPALSAHAEDSFFYASNSKVYKALTDISVGTTLVAGTNCVMTDIVSNLGGSGGSGGSSGHTICDENDIQYAQRSKLKIVNATITDDAANDTTVVTIQSGGSSTVLSQTLVAGNTSVTFPNIPTTGDYLIDFYTSDGVPYTDIDTSVSGQVTISFEAQSSNVTVFCEIKEIS